MPGPVLSENGENVLSSIRRLVSREPGEEPSAAREPVDEARERLLLTPAQRVDSPAAAQTGTPTDADPPYVLSRRVDTEPTSSHTAQAGDGDTDALDWQDRDEAPETGRAVGHGDPPSERSAPALRTRGGEGRALDLVGDTARPDDAALRDLVAEIVREELAGEMGDRITRNVRKLVRREIHRVLSGRKLD